ncbi:hypothetical protein [Xanthomonas melonis]|uniref:Secreted protein n=1 Tax=Xanthomonas melonis TaxID=56456 RepID=A0A2S7DHV2_9XANT|nr:hypothetical protein [Xanthomonas melonis]MCC4600129.1 hypothetical protein [Xanthomonas melonis]PPU73377.1 hypothetical protein XmelCFBP4644_07580 [Xanthomonas melonis]
MIMQTLNGHEAMRTHLAVALTVVALLTEPSAHAALPGESDAMLQWSQPGNCGRQRVRKPDPSDVFDAVSIREQTERYLGFLAEVMTGDQSALRLTRLCTAFGVDFVQGPLPPAHAEPWNPSPQQPTGHVFTAFTQEAGTPSRQQIEVTYRPSGIAFSLFTNLNHTGDSAVSGEPGAVQADMGQHCPLRLDELTQRMARAGFVGKYDGLQAPDEELAIFDDGVGVSFRRGNEKIVVDATLQGRFIDQRANPGASCLASISLRTWD